MQGLKVAVVVFFLGFATAVPTKEHDVYLQAVEKDLDDVENGVISCAKDAVPKIVACFMMGEWEHSEESSSEESLSEESSSEEYSSEEPYWEYWTYWTYWVYWAPYGELRASSRSEKIGDISCVIKALKDFVQCITESKQIEQDHITALEENRKEIEKNVNMALKKNALHSKA